MTELEKYDTGIYDEITAEDVWHYKVVEQAGVVKITAHVYQDRIYNKNQTWFFAFIREGNSATPAEDNSLFVMKSLYFLKKRHPDLNVGFVDVREEKIREAFDYYTFPAVYFVVSGQIYALPWDAYQIHKFEEFLIRYKEIACNDTYTQLNPLAEPPMIYYEYYTHHLGTWGKILYSNYFKLAVYTWDQDLEHKWIYKDFMYWWHDTIWKAHIKTAGKRFFILVLVPFLIVQVIGWKIFCLCCCQRRKIKTD